MGKRSQLRNATPLNLLFSKHYFDDDTESECDGLLSGSFADRIAEELLRDNASEESEQPTFASPISNQELNIAIADVGKVPIDDKSVHIKLLWALIAKQQEVISKGDGPGKEELLWDIVGRQQKQISEMGGGRMHSNKLLLDQCASKFIKNTPSLPLASCVTPPRSSRRRGPPQIISNSVDRSHFRRPSMMSEL